MSRTPLRPAALLAVTLAACGGTPRAPATGGPDGGGLPDVAPSGTGGSTPAPGTGGAGGTMAGGTGGMTTMAAGTPVTVALNAEASAERARLEAVRAESAGLDGAALLAKHKVPFRASLGYDPAKAVNLPLIQASQLKLDEAELAGLTSKGFVISDKRRYPHFAYGYKTIYSQDLPVYITADAILQAVHQSYDDILKTIELEALLPEMTALLAGMQGRLAGASTLEAVTRRDADVFLAVGLSLIKGASVAPVAGGSETDVAALVALANAGVGSKGLALFGAAREIDFSQFKPRGHYKDDPKLERYFRAMMWLGRIDFPFLQTNPQTGKPELVRRAVAAALALRSLMDADAIDSWKSLDATVRAFVGEPDSMGPLEVDRLKADLGLQGDTLGDVSDAKLAQAIIDGAYGKQRILSQIVLQEPHEGTWPLDATFLFFGQRYVFDSHVLSNVVYDRVNVPNSPKRMMPSPLDVAYAALGNDHAAKLLSGEIDQYRYAPALETIRRLGDEHGAGYWSANLYNLWLSALRTLSPGAEIGASGTGLPALASTEPWARRLLSTQLASWAELRHDTILYAKQSYTSGVACEFPDAYVEPYPAFFAQIEKLGAAGEALAATLPFPSGSSAGTRVPAYWKRLREVAGILREMAEAQRTGMPHKPEHLAFINRAVDLDLGCGGPAGIRGWYADLYFNAEEAAAFNPTIADVHTQPTDEAGTPVGHVLHAGTGYPRLMVVTVETCMGPRAYAGVAFSYHEVITKDFERLDDAAWAEKFRAPTLPDDVAWMKDLIVK